MTTNIKVSAKAFIVKHHRVLAVKRSNYTPQMPGIWELPGGGLENGENPIDGLKREVKEETGLDITVDAPLSVRHFQRVDGPFVYLTIFVCTSNTQTIKLSHEHDAYDWLDIANAKQKIAEFYFHEIDEYQKRFETKK